MPEPERVAALGVTDALAAMRDLGILLGSLKRHGVEPVAAVPDVLPVLEELGRRTDMVPRDTVHHSRRGTRSAPGSGCTPATSWRAISRTRSGWSSPVMVAALDACAELARRETCEPGFATALDRTAQHVQSMVDSIDFTVANVSLVFFATRMRSYFEEIDVAGTDYLGPAAAQVPLWLVDLTLWQCDRGRPEPTTPSSTTRCATASPPGATTTPRTRAAPPPSPSSRRHQLGGGPRLPPQLAASAISLARVLRILKTFRARHMTIARKAYSEDVRLYDVGSGGAPIELLRSVLDLTRDNETLVRRSIERPRTPVA